MPIEPTILVVLVLGLATGVILGWLAARPGLARLRSEIDRDRAIHAERLRAYDDAGVKLRETFQALSAEALKSNNEQFLSLAHTRLQQARTEAATDIDSRKKAIEDLLAPMAKTLEQVDRELRESERRRIESGATLIEKIASCLLYTSDAADE